MNKSFPVKYMVIQGVFLSDVYHIQNTSSEGQELVACSMSLPVAHKICKFLNESEGYRYDIE